MVKRPTISDLAAAAGVSVATVDRVLNRRLPVREDTALRVVGAAEQIGFHATGLLRRRISETPVRRFGFLLQKRHDAFYHSLGEGLLKAARSAENIQVKPVIDYSDDLVPATIAERLLALAERSDAVAVVPLDHPTVAGAVEEIAARGKPVITLLSDVVTPSRTSYIAVDYRKAGRTAAWIIERAARRPGKVGILVGSHRYLNQELAEISFRSYMREHVPELQILEPMVNLDDDRLAEEAVTEMLRNNDDIVGLYACGGGQDGFLRALRAEARGRRIVAICNELTATTRAALIDGTLDLALGTPIEAVAARTIAIMATATEAWPGSPAPQVLFPADLHISETI